MFDPLALASHGFWKQNGTWIMTEEQIGERAGEGCVWFLVTLIVLIAFALRLARYIKEKRIKRIVDHDLKERRDRGEI